MNKLLIRSGTVITSQSMVQADIYVEDGKIRGIGQDLSIVEDAQVVDAAGMYVMPGGVDVHVHLDLPMFGTVSSDDHYTGMKAAAMGGTTTVIDFVPQDQSPLLANLETWHARADSKAAVDYGFHMNITKLDAQVEADLPLLVQEGVTSIKVFTAYNNRLRLADGDIFRLMRIASKYQMLTMLHAENGDIIDLLVAEALQAGHTEPIWHARTRPAWGAVEAALRGAAFAAQSGAPLYLVHMNTAGEVDMLQYARSCGVPMMGETCPQYLFFTETELMREDGAKWICSPPVRTEFDQIRLWQGLADGIIQAVSTDHCPFFFDGTKEVIYEGTPIKIPGKELGRQDFTRIPNGLPGVGDRLPVVWTEGVGNNRLTPQQFVNLHSTQPARIFGLYPRKGALIPGSDADIVIWDPKVRVKYGVSVAGHRTDYNLYEGWNLCGFPRMVFLRGKKIYQDGTWFGKPGMGTYLKRSSGEIL
ncbi:MAG TPA: dihydropyrimidinase [Anaerolineaceae bacterium]|nr:dihydropyrimidinase [Anaerolineaceae bacterium]HQO96255.1 dihydropyrimidinase [Anaerolineaceae bacterium]